MAEGQRDVLDTSLEAEDRVEAAIESMLGRSFVDKLKLLSDLRSSALAFRFSTMAPPEMITGLMRSARKESPLTRLSFDD